MSRRNLLSAAMSIVFILCVFVAGSIRMGLAEDSQGDGLAVTVTTEDSEYKIGHQVMVEGVVYNASTGETVAAKVLIQIFREGAVLYRVSTIASENGSYFDKGYYVYETGVLNITSYASSGGYNGTASTTVLAVAFRDIFDLGYTYFLQILGVVLAILYFILLLVWSVSKRHKEKEEDPTRETLEDKIRGTMFVVFEFLLLTFFTISIIVALVFTPRPIGQDSPLGVVLNTYGNETQWVINLGGTKVYGASQYSGGVQIPIYVLGLSFIGAYVYFLSKVPELVKSKYQELHENSLLYLVRFFIAPLLAVALYLVLWEVEVRGHFILAAVSFTVGLIIEDVIIRILEFAKDVIGKIEKPEEKIKKQITTLKDLHEKGMLTDEEFKSKKKESLKKL